jgi:cytochrome c peroxidase
LCDNEPGPALFDAFTLNPKPSPLLKSIVGAILTLATGLAAYLWASSPLTAPAEDVSAPAPRKIASEPILPLPSPQLDPAKVALGRHLFFDPRLSADNTIACANCHDLKRGGADSHPLSIGIRGQAGNINSPSVLNAAYNFRQFWDGRVASLKEQVGGPINNPVEMGSNWPQVIVKLQADRELTQALAQIYGDRQWKPEYVTDVIAEFERSLPRPSRFDRWLGGDVTALSSDEAAGYRLFKEHGCIACHQGVNIGGNLYQRFGVMDDYFANKGTQTAADQGLFNVSGREADRHVFKVPSLRNVALTAPYFHDASAATLEDAVRVMGRYQLGVELPTQDTRLIVAFLRALDGEPQP